MNMAVTFLVTLVVVQVKYIATTPARDSGQTSGCKVMQHFQSPYVTPLVEQVSQVTGCLSKHVSSKSQEIYILSLSSSGVNGSVGAKLGYLPSISLHVRPRSRQSAYTNPFVIILHSSDPVMWHLHVHNVENASNLSLVVNKPSQLVSSTPVSMSRKRLPPTDSLISWAHNQYGAVTSFSNISLANKISLFIGIDEQSPDHCNNSSSAISDVLNAVYVQPQPAAGCAVKESENANHTWTQIVHVVDVESSGLGSTIIVHIQPHGVRQPSEEPIIEQNLILVLKSHSLVSWCIDSWGIQGQLKIVAEHPVHIQTSPSYQVMEVQDKILPSSTTALLTNTEQEYGQVFTYTKAARANRINIIIKGPEIGSDNLSVQSDSHFSSQQSSSKVPFPLLPAASAAATVDVNEKQPLNATRVISAHDGSAYSMIKSGRTNEKTNPKNILQYLLAGDLSINCMDTITILLPYEKVNQVLNSVLDQNRELLSITLNDSRCKADVSNSYIVLHSTWSGCGAKLVSIGGREIHYNQVQFLTRIPSSSDPTTSGKSAMPNDDEDLTESGSGMNIDFLDSETEESRDVQISYILPYQCSRHLPQSTVNANGDFKLSGEAVFRLNLYLDKSFRNALPDQQFPLKMAAHDYMFAEAIIEADPFTCVATEECWLSAYSNGSYETTKSMLIKKGCPSDLSVEMISKGSCQDQHPFSSRRWQRFSFQISEEFVNEYLYLHCRLSTCAMANAEQRRMKQCTDMQDFCLNQSLRPFLKLPAGKKYSLEVRGPLHVFAKRRNGGNKDTGVIGLVNVSSPPFKDSEVSEKNPITQVILIGLTTEAVVGIAFASFVIGAGLMATLWLIHLRTDPSRRIRSQQRQMPQPHQPNHHSGYDLSGHSGSSTPSSQAPMTVHACT